MPVSSSRSRTTRNGSHPDKQLDVYEAVIRENGWRKAVVVSKRSGFIVKEHGTWLTAKRTGWKIRLKPRNTLRLRKNRKLLIALNSALKPDPIMLGIKTVTNGPFSNKFSMFATTPRVAYLFVVRWCGYSHFGRGHAFLTEEPRFRKPGWCWRLGTKRESRRRR